MTARPQRVVIVGGGFAGLSTAQALRHAPVEVTLLDRRNFHLFQPLLYQVATGGLSPANIATPLRYVLRSQKNATVLLGEVTDFDIVGRRVILKEGGDAIEYDTLVVATGVRHHYFGHPEWEQYAPGLKTIEDATAIRRRILSAFEAAERQSDATERAAWLTFIIAGGGPTGVELAGTLGELAHTTLRRDFRRIDPRQARIYLVEGVDRVLNTFPPQLSEKAAKSLKELGVTVRTGTLVTSVQPDGVTLKTGDQVEDVRAYTVLWAAGVQASPLGKLVAERAGVQVDRVGRVVVEPDLTLPGHPEIFVLGDLASSSHQFGRPLPGVAPVAMQQGRYVASTIRSRLQNKRLAPFHYKDKGNMATIGRTHAVADLHWLRLSGYPAWLAWLFIHLVFIIIFTNRILILIQWGWNYVTRNRSARLITGEPPALFHTGRAEL